jgi:NitT/TauT family transport system substrate-binding protein
MQHDLLVHRGLAPSHHGAQNLPRPGGINITLDGSGGSVESVTRVATGTHPLGLADLSTLVECSAQSEEAPTLIMTVFDRQQLAA